MYSGDTDEDFKLNFHLESDLIFDTQKRLIQYHNVLNLLQFKQLLKHMGSPSLQTLDPGELKLRP